MSLYVGLDSSTQGITAVVIDGAAGRVVHEQSVSFGDDLPEYGCPFGVLPNPDPLVKESNPLLWCAALDLLLARVRAAGVDLARVAGVSGCGQQHGTVYLNARFRDPAAWPTGPDLAARVRPLLSRATAPIWMDSSTSAECVEITRAVGGSREVQRRSGSPAVERFSGPQIRRFYKAAPGAYADTAVVHLVSSFMCSLLIGRSAPVDGGDGAGTNLMNLASGGWDADLVAATAPGLAQRLPDLCAGNMVVGEIAPYFSQRYGFRRDAKVVVWSGDNPSSLIGVGGWRTGTAVVSLGTSDTYFAAMDKPCVDPAGYGHVFANPAGGYMSLICFKNGALARDRVRTECGVDWQGFERSLDQTAPGNGGNLMLPYFVPEITPLVLRAQPVYRGTDAFVAGRDLTARVRAVVEAQALGLRHHSAWIPTKPGALRVTGGGAANTGICRVLADVFQARVERLATSNSAALGAAMRTAHAVEELSWDVLTDTYCRAADSCRVEPRPESACVYDALAREYAALATDYGKAAAP